MKTILSLALLTFLVSLSYSQNGEMLPKMVTLTENKITVSDTSSVAILSELSLPHFRKIIGMDTFFAISAKDFRGTNIQIARYQKFIRGARMAIDTLIAANKNLQDANTFSQKENTELRTANAECNKVNTEYLGIIKTERKKSRRQKYIYGFSGTGVGLIGGLILGIVLR